MRTLVYCILLGVSLSLTLLLVFLIASTSHSLVLTGLLLAVAVLAWITTFQYWFASRRTPWLWFWYRRAAFWLFTLSGRNPLCASRDEAIFFASAANFYPMYAALDKCIQLLETDSEGRMLWQTPLGPFWIPKGASRRWLIALIAEQLQNAYAYEVLPGANHEVVLDCGANVGDFSRLALDRGASMVVAIEPSPETAVCLRRNLADAIAAGRAVVYENGVWDCEVKLYLETDNVEVPGSHHVSANPDQEKQGAWVKLTTIDTIVNELKVSQVSFIKMDVEGAEQKALLGATHSIELHKPRLAIATEHTRDRLANSSAVLEILKKMQPAYTGRSISSVIVSSPNLGYVVVPEIIYFDIARA